MPDTIVVYDRNRKNCSVLGSAWSHSSVAEHMPNAKSGLNTGEIRKYSRFVSLDISNFKKIIFSKPIKLLISYLCRGPYSPAPLANKGVPLIRKGLKQETSWNIW